MNKVFVHVWPRNKLLFDIAQTDKVTRWCLAEFRSKLSLNIPICFNRHLTTSQIWSSGERSDGQEVSRKKCRASLKIIHRNACSVRPGITVLKNKSNGYITSCRSFMVKLSRHYSRNNYQMSVAIKGVDSPDHKALLWSSMLFDSQSRFLHYWPERLKTHLWLQSGRCKRDSSIKTMCSQSAQFLDDRARHHSNPTGQCKGVRHKHDNGR